MSYGHIVRHPRRPVSKDAFVKAIQDRADEIFPSTLSPPRRFAKALMEDRVSQALYKGLKSTPSRVISEQEPAQGRMDHAGADRRESRRQRDERESLRPGDRLQSYAEAKLHSLAIDHAKATGKSYERAYAMIYSDPEDYRLREQAKREHLARQLAEIHGDGAIG